jgi:hypothetical protein
MLDEQKTLSEIGATDALALQRQASATETMEMLPFNMALKEAQINAQLASTARTQQLMAMARKESQSIVSLADLKEAIKLGIDPDSFKGVDKATRDLAVLETMYEAPRTFDEFAQQRTQELVQMAGSSLAKPGSFNPEYQAGYAIVNVANPKATTDFSQPQTIPTAYLVDVSTGKLLQDSAGNAIPVASQEQFINFDANVRGALGAKKVGEKNTSQPSLDSFYKPLNEVERMLMSQ